MEILPDVTLQPHSEQLLKYINMVYIPIKQIYPEVLISNGSEGMLHVDRDLLNPLRTNKIFHSVNMKTSLSSSPINALQSTPLAHLSVDSRDTTTVHHTICDTVTTLVYFGFRDSELMASQATQR